MKLAEDFYLSADVVQIAKDLLGKYLMTCFNGAITGGVIVETEAYEGVTDRASHAYNNRRTARTEVMYAKGGRAYVYLCYGIHSLFNIVTNVEDIPHAILVRGIVPSIGTDLMKERAGKRELQPEDGIGPGKVSKLLGIHYTHTGESLTGNKIWIEDKGFKTDGLAILSGPRIGVGYAGSDALLPYRFRLRLEDVLK